MMSFRADDRGGSLVETMIAVLVAFIAMSSVGVVVFSAMVQNKNEGAETTRMTALAREKLEQLLWLDYGDTTTNTTLITDTGWSVGLTSNAATDLDQLNACPSPGSPNEGYVDYLDSEGVPLSGGCSAAIAGGFAYLRRWRITTEISGPPGLKQITVAVYALNAVRAGGQMPVVTLTSYRSQ